MEIPLDILKLVATYFVKPKTKLLDWIPIDKLDRMNLSGNPNAIHLLKKNPDKINWDKFSQNPSIFEPSIFETDVKQYKIDITEKANIIDNILYKN